MEPLLEEVLSYVIDVLEAKRGEFSGFAVCPFVKADRIADQLFLKVYDNEKQSFLSVAGEFIKSGKRSALIAQINGDVPGDETKGYQQFINMLLDEAGYGNIGSLCFNPKDELEIDGYNPRSLAPCFLINLAYKKDLSKGHRSLKRTKYYDNMPKKYLEYLGVKK